MGDELAIALVVFFATSAAVIFFGTRLAVYGDALASLTGWGRLFVGSLLLAAATSLPELSTSFSAVSLDPPNPELSVGDALGSNMLNMLILAMVVLAFGGKRFLQRVAPEQGYLILVAAVMTGAAVIFGAVKMDVAVWQVGLSSLIMLVLFVLGMRWVYLNRPKEREHDSAGDNPGMTLKKAWLMFGLVSAGVVVAGIFLAWSADQIAEITGVASSTLGILAVSLVTSMPEVATTIAAARMGAADLGVAGLFGSCTFNVTVLFYADFFYREGILVNQMEPAHFVAGGVALGLILAGMVLILGRNRMKRTVVATGLALMALVYVAGAASVITLGTTEDDDSQVAATRHWSISVPSAQ
jgi:cation:H+ antiporter